MTGGREFIAKMIEQYKKLPCLWNTADSEYYDKNKRNKGWEQMLRVCKEYDPTATTKSVVAKMNSIRGAFRKELKKVQSSGENSDKVHIPKLWYYNLLLFVDDKHCLPNYQSIIKPPPKVVVDSSSSDDEEVPLDVIKASSSRLDMVATPSCRLDLVAPPSSRLDLVEAPPSQIDHLAALSSRFHLATAPSSRLNLVAAPPLRLVSVAAPPLRLVSVTPPLSRPASVTPPSSPPTSVTPSSSRQSTPSPEPSRSLKRPSSEIDQSKQREVLEKIAKRLDQSLQTPGISSKRHGIFGEYVADKLRCLPPRMATICQKIINDAIFYAEINTLNLSSRIVNDDRK